MTGRVTAFAVASASDEIRKWPAPTGAMKVSHTGAGPSMLLARLRRRDNGRVNNELDQLAAEIDSTCRLSGDFTLRSGLRTSEYFDKYRFESRPDLLRRIAEAMVPLLPESTEVVGGLELGGVPIATMVSALTGIPAVFVRKEAKTYGTCQLAEGSDINGTHITLIEDVITTGGAVRNAAIALRALGAHVDTVICAIDRSEQGANKLSESGITTRAVLTKTDLDRAASFPS